MASGQAGMQAGEGRSGLDRARLLADIAASGLDDRGIFHPEPGDVEGVEGGRDTTIVLLGFAGRGGFARFASSPERSDGRAHPLDRWSRRVVEGLAAAWGGQALFPFGGPPWHPFQRWAMKAEPVRPSPMGLLIHPTLGLWHSYRGAVLLPVRIDGATVDDAVPHPCAPCRERPCLGTCPVGAYSDQGFDMARCVAHLGVPAGAECRERGCLARRACPVGREHAHEPAQASFTSAAFLAARLVDPPQS